MDAFAVSHPSVLRNTPNQSTMVHRGDVCRRLRALGAQLGGGGAAVPPTVVAPAQEVSSSAAAASSAAPFTLALQARAVRFQGDCLGISRSF